MNDIVEDAIEALRDDMEEAIRNVQCDFLRKLQRQAEDFKAMLDDQRIEIEDLVNENAMLRAQNSNLQRNYNKFGIFLCFNKWVDSLIQNCNK